MNLKDQVKIVGAASKYADTAGRFLSSELGRPATQQDVVTFASALSAIFGSWVYNQMHAAGGQAPADMFLKQIFMQLAASVQQRGTPIALEISFKSIPITTETGGSEIIQEEEKCSCLIDQTGNCPSCEKSIRSMIENLSGLAEAGITLRGGGACKICSRALIDPVFADIIKSDKFKKMPKEASDTVIAMIVESARAVGAGEIPMIEKALGELK